MIDWFRSLPLWLDLGGLRVVHACWNEADFEHLAQLASRAHTLTDEVIVAGSTKGTRTYEAIETVLKGPELPMDGAYYFDKDGHRRDRARARWWNASATTLRQAAAIPGDSRLHGGDDEPLAELPNRPLAEGEIPRYHDDVPVIFGHYWFTGAPKRLGPSTACVDYSAAKGGPLVAYRWNGERVLDDRNFVAC